MHIWLIGSSFDHNYLLLLIHASILTCCSSGRSYSCECRPIRIKCVLVLLAWDGHHVHLLLLGVAYFTLVTIWGSAVLRALVDPVFWILCFRLVWVGAIKVISMSADGAFVTRSYVSAVLMDKQWLLITMWRPCDSHMRHSTHHGTRTSSERSELTYVWHPKNICVWRIPHRLIVPHLRRCLLQEMGVIHPATRQYLMSFIWPQIAHLLIHVHPMHLLLEVVAAIFRLVSKQACYVSTHLEERRALVWDAVVHVVVGCNLAWVASAELGL